MQKQLKWCLAGAFLLAALTVPALAHSHPGDPAPTAPTTSSWAQAEVKKAQDLGLIPDWGLPEDYRKPITRQQFRMVAMRFVEAQENYDSLSLQGMVTRYLGEQDAIGQLKQVFSDGDQYDSAAYYLGVVQGRGGGIFDPEGLITREEAAVMLTRAYDVIGDALSDKGKSKGFTDGDKISQWAKASAVALASWDVMRGMEDGSFSPKGNYSVEQCIATFVRLYENAPVSKRNDNVTPLFTYEQGLAYAGEDADYLAKTIQVDGKAATFLRMDLQGMLKASSTFYFVYRDGGVQRLDLGLCNMDFMHISPDLKLENPRFSEDGKTFYGTMTIRYQTGASKPPHSEGIYHIAIDVETGTYQHTVEPLPE